MKQEIFQSAEPRLSSPEERALTFNEIAQIRKLKCGNRMMDLVEMKDDGSAIFKKCSDVSMKYERACSLIDLFLGFDFVPPTVIREINGEVGSAQHYIENAPTSYELTEHERKAIPKKELLKLDIFDYIVNNEDRHDNNYLIKNDKIYAIDNEFTFSEQYSDYARHNWERHGTMNIMVPQEIKDKLASFVGSESKKRILKELLSELIPEERIEFMFKRAEAIYKIICKNGMIPKDKLKHLS